MGEPIRYSNSQSINLSGYKFYLPLYPEVGYGDKIIVEGKVNGKELKNVNLIEVTKSQGILYKFRNNVVSFFLRNLPQPHAGLLAGIVIGSKANLGDEFWNSLKNSGTAHVVVASGMNVTLIAGFLISFLVLILPRRKAIPLALAGIWLYAILAGFEAPIVRAAVMGSIAFTAQELGRLYYALRSLLISAFLMVFIRPDWITDLGFIMSFTATLSMIIFVPGMQRVFKFLPKRIGENFVTTLSAQIGVAPILYLSFGQFNLLSPLVNVLVLWTIVPLTMIGIIAGIIGTLFEPLGRILVLLTYPLTFWFVTIVQTCG
jgi:competence protein ComEC